MKKIKHHQKTKSFIEDITEKKTIETNLNLLREAVEQSPVTVVISDSQGLIEYVNPFFCKLTGYSRSDIMGQNPRILKSGNHSSEFYRNLWTTLCSGNVWRGEIQNKKKNGELFWEDAVISPIKNNVGEITHFVAVKKDISEKKNADLKLSDLSLQNEMILNSVRESEERFRGAFETAPHGMALVSKEGRWLKVNQSMCQIIGYSMAELLSIDFQTITHPDDLDTDLDYVKQLLDGRRESYQMEKRYIHKDGHFIWILLSVSLVKNADGTPLYFVSQIQDIDERKKTESLKQSESLLNKILLELNGVRNVSVSALSDIAVDGAVRLTQSRYGFFATVDVSTRRMTVRSWSQDVWINCSMQEHQFDMLLDELAMLGRAVETGETSLVNDYQASNHPKHHVPDGHVQIQRYLAVPLLKQNQVIAIMAVANKIEHYTETDARLLNRFLDGAWNVVQHRIDEDAVESARQTAEQASKTKSEFLANMSHEIRTPLNTIIGMGQLMSQTDLTPKQQGKMRKILNAAESLLVIIDEILDFSKIEAGHLHLEHIPFDLDEVIEKVTSQISFKAHEKNLDIIFSIPSTIPRLLVGDPMRLQQVLLNLGGNAVKFTNHGKIIFTIDMAHDEDGHPALSFSVSDTGIGISDTQMTHLFQEFSQADSSTTRLYGGTGLGLAICDRLVGLMGGKINVQSTPGQGSVFSFTVLFDRQAHDKEEPLNPPSSLSNRPIRDVNGEPYKRPAGKFIQEASYQNHSELKGSNILVVEDHEVNWEVVEAIVSKSGIHAHRAVNGQAAVQQILENNQNFDAVLMDLQMPVMDGYQATRIIRETYREDQLPIIAMTANAIITEKQKCLDVGMNDYLTKPVKIKTLLDTLMRWIKQKPAKDPTGTQTCEIKPCPELTLPGIDMADAMTRLQGDQVLLKTLVRSFAKKNQGVVASLRTLHGSGDHAAFDRVLHGLKGTSGGISALNIYRLVKDLEQELSRSDHDKIFPLLAQLDAAFSQIKKTADTLTNDTICDDEQDLGSDNPVDLIMQLNEFLISADFQAKECFACLKPVLKNREYDSIMNDLGFALDDLDFEQARVFLDSLKKKLNITLSENNDAK
ncbi:MAG: PAS domain S-box protein [Proteobacteria bacterium]|nr:PAS domain S-box protein [Pseudomonadota bacterium]